MTEDEVRTTLRMPRWLHEHVSAAASRQRRSLNSEIILHLETLAGGMLGRETPASVTEPSVLTHAQSHHQG